MRTAIVRGTAIVRRTAIVRSGVLALALAIGAVAGPAQARKPEGTPTGYNTQHLMRMTRVLADSEMSVWWKPPLFVVLTPIDLMVLPFAAFGGIWGYTDVDH